MDVVSEQTGAPVPPPGIPGPFALGEAGELRRLLDKAGLTDVQVGELSVPLADRVVRRMVGADVGTRGPAVGDPRRRCPRRPCRRMRERASAAVRRYENASGGLDFPGVALIAGGRRA